VLTNLPYASNAFDLVFSSDVLEHIHEDEVFPARRQGSGERKGGQDGGSNRS